MATKCVEFIKGTDIGTKGTSSPGLCPLWEEEVALDPREEIKAPGGDRGETDTGGEVKGG